MANGSSLVPSVAPLVQSLQQFTPRAREDRRLQLAGLQQQSDLGQQRLDIGAQQLAQQKLETERNKALSIGNRLISELDEDVTDIDLVMAGEPDQIANNITRILQEKQDDETFDNQDAISLRNLAIQDPNQVIAIMQKRREQIIQRRDDAQSKVDRLSGVAARRSDARSFKPTEFSNGTTVTFDNRGNRVVRDGTGQTLTGQEAQEAIEKGVDSGILEAAERKERVGLAGGSATRATSVIDRGVSSAETIGELRRTQDLLERVETGGVDAISLAARRRLGVETADEGELAFALSKGVLTQLKETFGAAFTKAEGDTLARIETSLTKSPAANKRLIKRAIDLATRSAKRGRRAAVRAGQDDVVADIDELLNQVLTTEGFVDVEPTGDTGQQTVNQQQQTQTGTTGQQQQLSATGPNGEKLLLINGQWVRQ